MSYREVKLHRWLTKSCHFEERSDEKSELEKADSLSLGMTKIKGMRMCRQC